MAADPKNRVQPDSVETGARILVACVCGKQSSIQLEHLGESLRCGNCGRTLVVDPYSTTAQPQAESVAIDPEAGTLAEAGESPLIDRPCMLAPAQAPDEMGRLGPYRVLRVLGIGGMGVVYKAEDPSLGRIVALKAMLPSASQKKTAKERFLREARAAAALKHDHVVSIFQVGEDRGTPYLAMEFLDGESLEELLKRERRLPLGDALRIGREIADGLGAAHEHGLIHRDIKPANVWIEKRPTRRKDGSGASRLSARAKILDFGLARGVDDASITQSGAVIGTPAYMPIEQARGEHVDARCDLYSLGVVLYRMVTGRLPFEGNNLISVLAAMVTQTPIEPCVHDPSIPPTLNTLILRLISKNADDRPASAQEVYDALSDIEPAPGTQAPVTPLAALASAPTLKPASTLSSPPARKPVTPRPDRPKRGPLLALAMGAIAVVVLVAAIGLLRSPPRGTVRLESEDPNVEIVFDNTGPTIQGTSKSPGSSRPPPGSALPARPTRRHRTSARTLDRQ